MRYIQTERSVPSLHSGELLIAPHIRKTLSADTTDVTRMVPCSTMHVPTFSSR